MPSPLAIDISHHQPDPIDFAKVKAAGIVGVIHKATEGSSYKDDKLYSRAKAAMAAGLKWSTYHFLRPGNMQQQMDWYLSVVDPKQGERLCLDHEDAGVSLAQLEQCVSYLLSKRPDLQLTVYSGHVIKDQLGSKKSELLAASSSLWLAQYTTGTPSWPTATWPAWSLWQYTDKGSIPGISGYVDLDQFNGSAEQCAKWFGPVAEPAPTPEPEPELEEVTVRIEASANVTVNIYVNDQQIARARGSDAWRDQT